MNDVGLFVENGKIDIRIENGDLVSDDGLETAVLISIFTDRRATQEELPAGQTKRRGWWGDLFPDVDGDKIGSKLWLLDNDKQILSSLPKFEQYAEESLNWLIEDGVAEEIDVVATYPSRGIVEIKIDIFRPSGENSKFGFIWDGQELKRG